MNLHGFRVGWINKIIYFTLKTSCSNFRILGPSILPSFPCWSCTTAEPMEEMDPWGIFLGDPGMKGLCQRSAVFAPSLHLLEPAAGQGLSRGSARCCAEAQRESGCSNVPGALPARSACGGRARAQRARRDRPGQGGSAAARLRHPRLGAAGLGSPWGLLLGIPP